MRKTAIFYVRLDDTASVDRTDVRKSCKCSKANHCNQSSMVKVEKVTGIFAENVKANKPILRIACFCLIGDLTHGSQTAGYSDLLKFYFGWSLLTTSYGFINTFGATWPLE